MSGSVSVMRGKGFHCTVHSYLYCGTVRVAQYSNDNYVRTVLYTTPMPDFCCNAAIHTVTTRLKN